MQEAVVDDRSDTLGSRPPEKRLGAQLLVGRDHRIGQRWRQADIYRFFLRAKARSILRGWTDRPSSV